MRNRFILSITFLLLLLPQSLWAEGQTTANYDQWMRLHTIHMKAQRALTPEAANPGEKFTRAEFDALVKDAALRELYTQKMDTIVEECSARLDIFACQELLNAVEEGDLGVCLGAENFNYASDSFFKLNEDVAVIIEAKTQKSDHSKYSNSSQVTNMIARLRRNLTLNCTVSGCSSKRKPGSKAKCLRYVKLGILAGGFTKNYSGTKMARDYGGDLRSMGFTNLMASNKSINARNAPKGAVLVYSGGCCGHIEVKAGDNEFLSDFKSGRPINEYLPRKLIGVYVK